MTKDSKMNIIAMAVIIVILAAGIILRWDYVSKELKETFGRYSEMFEGKSAQSPVAKDTVPQ